MVISSHILSMIIDMNLRMYAYKSQVSLYVSRCFDLDPCDVFTIEIRIKRRMNVMFYQDMV